MAKTKPTSSSASVSDKDKKTLASIQKLAASVVRTVAQGNNPAMSIRIRALSNVSFNEKKRMIELGQKAQSREFFNTSMARKFMQTCLIADGCRTLNDTGKTVSIRQMYYMSKHGIRGSNENTFEDQDESDPIIEDLEVGIDALREELHLFANRKGIVVGKLTVWDSGDTIDLSRMGSGGWGIPSICEPDRVRFTKNEAEFVLLVEKQAVWHRLREDGFWKKHN